MVTGMSGSLDALVLVKPRQLVKTVAASGTPEQFTRRSVTSLTRNGKTVTAACTAHDYAVGDEVTISGAAETEYNGRFRIKSVADANTFTYELETLNANTAGAASGTLVAVGHVYFRRATVLGKSAPRVANVGDVHYGPTATNNDQPFTVGSNVETKIEAPAGCKYDGGEWYLDVDTGADGVVLILS